MYRGLAKQVSTGGTVKFRPKLPCISSYAYGPDAEHEVTEAHTRRLLREHIWSCLALPCHLKPADA